MGWGSDDDEDENELIDWGAVEDRGRRGRQAREHDEEEEEEEEAEEDHVERKAATEDGEIEEQRPLPHPRSSRSPHPSSTSPPPPPPRPDDAASTDAAAQKATVQNNTQIALLYLTHKVAEEVGRERAVKFSKQVLSCVRDIVAGYAQTVGKDVELFAKHAKRSVGRPQQHQQQQPHHTTTMNMDDVMLVARRNASLTSALESFKEKEGIGAKKRKPKQGNKRKSTGDSDEEQGGEEQGEEAEVTVKPARGRRKR